MGQKRTYQYIEPIQGPINAPYKQFMEKRNDLNNKKELKPLQVTYRKGESVDRMIRRFTKKVKEDGILKDFMSRTYHEKPSIVRRRKKLKARWTAKAGNRAIKK